jgi:hypothetical protein
MSGTMKLPPFLQRPVHRPTIGDWETEVELILGNGNTYTVCLFTDPDPTLRERFDGTAQCTQEGHSLYGTVPVAETAVSFDRLRKVYKNGAMTSTSAIRMSLDDSTRQASQRESPGESFLIKLTRFAC